MCSNEGTSIQLGEGQPLKGCRASQKFIGEAGVRLVTGEVGLRTRCGGGQKQCGAVILGLSSSPSQEIRSDLKNLFNVHISPRPASLQEVLESSCITQQNY